MKIFHKKTEWTLDWFLDKYVAFEQIVSEGNSVMGLFWSKAKNIITYTLVVSGISVGAEKGLGMEIFSQLPSWLQWAEGMAYFIFQKAIFILPAIPILELVKDFYLGLWSRKHHYWHKKAEWLMRKGINTWEKEKMDRLREIHAKQCPKSKIPSEGYGYVKENEFLGD